MLVLLLLSIFSTNLIKLICLHSQATWHSKVKWKLAECTNNNTKIPAKIRLTIISEWVANSFTFIRNGFSVVKRKNENRYKYQIYILLNSIVFHSRRFHFPLLKIILRSFFGSSSTAPALSSLDCSEAMAVDFECTQNITSKTRWISFSVTQLPDGISVCVSVPLRHSIFVIILSQKHMLSHWKQTKQKTFYRKIPKPQNHILFTSF